MKNLVYFGSPTFSAQILESLLISRTVLEVVGVVTTPDEPVGRRQIITPSPVAQIASKHKLPIFKPSKLDPQNLAHIKLLKPDIFLVASYGKIIPQNWLEAPSIGSFNIHFSLLPKYRGALCISEAIKNQDKETGVTLMKMDEQLDHGPILVQEKVSIDINDNLESLTPKLTQAAITLLRQNLNKLEQLSETVQDESQATYTPPIKTRTRQSAFIPWQTIQEALAGTNASAIHALIRSNNPDPGAWTKIDSLEIKIIQSSLQGSSLKLDNVQLPGKQPISWKQFLAGHPIPHSA